MELTYDSIKENETGTYTEQFYIDAPLLAKNELSKYTGVTTGAIKSIKMEVVDPVTLKSLTNPVAEFHAILNVENRQIFTEYFTNAKPADLTMGEFYIPSHLKTRITLNGSHIQETKFSMTIVYSIFNEDFEKTFKFQKIVQEKNFEPVNIDHYKRDSRNCVYHEIEKVHKPVEIRFHSLKVDRQIV